VISRRDTLRALAAAGVAVPALASCGAGDSSGSGGSAGGIGNDPGATSGQIRLVGADVPRSAGSPRAVPGAVASLAAFTTDLWDRLPTSDNLAISPYSIAVALAMTANGAAGQTQQQMLDVLHIDSLATYNAGTAALMQALESLAGQVPLSNGTTGQIDLAVADQLFGDRSTDFGRAFLTVLAKEYGAGVRTVDFQNAGEQGRALINHWTAGQTHDRIPEILPAGVLDPSTRLVLVNALYFKAPWEKPFEKQETRQRTFHLSDGSPVEVPMMHQMAATASYLAGPHWRGARLPYAGGTSAMTLALPDPGHEADTLAALMEDGALTGDGQPGLDLQMPRWTFRSPTDLVSPLKRLGMTRAFDDGADFTTMSAAPLYIHDVLHQAFIAVDEDGTEAAAATAVVMDESSAILARQTLVLDRPFLFVIHDTAHGTPLFVGRVADPS
jgi:serine protease inhibitor